MKCFVTCRDGGTFLIIGNEFTGEITAWNLGEKVESTLEERTHMQAIMRGDTQEKLSELERQLGFL